MNKFEAEKLVQDYGGAVAKGSIKRLEWLPASKTKIKFAFFTYIESIINELGSLPEEIGQSWVVCYGMLNNFVDNEKADRIERIQQLITNKSLDSNKPEDKALYEEYFEYIYLKRCSANR